MDTTVSMQQQSRNDFNGIIRVINKLSYPTLKVHGLEESRNTTVKLFFSYAIKKNGISSFLKSLDGRKINKSET